MKIPIGYQILVDESLCNTDVTRFFLAAGSTTPTKSRSSAVALFFLFIFLVFMRVVFGVVDDARCMEKDEEKLPRGVEDTDLPRIRAVYAYANGYPSVGLWMNGHVE